MNNPIGAEMPGYGLQQPLYEVVVYKMESKQKVLK
jgi:hypothetical protein